MDDLYARLKPPVPALADADRAALRRSLFGTAETVRCAPTDGITVRLTPRSPHHRPRRAMTAAAAAIGVAGLVGLLAVDRDDPAPSAGTTAPVLAWQPPGEEFPLTDLGPVTESQGGPVVEALTRRVEVPGFAERIVAPSLTYSGGTTAELQFCVWSERGGGCRPEWNPLTWSFSDDADEPGGLFTLEGLPTDVAFVSYSDGATEYWQRPVFGFAAFPNLPGTDEVVTAWDVDGSPVGDYGSAAYLDPQSDAALPPDVGLADDVSNDLFQLTWASMRTCLAAQGGAVGDSVFSVATFPDDVDQLAVWDECVAEVKATIAQRVAELT